VAGRQAWRSRRCRVYVFEYEDRAEALNELGRELSELEGRGAGKALGRLRDLGIPKSSATASSR
jgi:hypothetical protein